MATRYSITTNEHDKAMRLMNADNAYATLWDFHSWLRNQIKHLDKDYEEVHEMLFEIMEENGFDFSSYR